MGGAFQGAFAKDPSFYLQHGDMEVLLPYRVTDEEAEAQRGSVTTQSHTANVSKAEI